jgi:hypothetical protein
MIVTRSRRQIQIEGKYMKKSLFVLMILAALVQVVMGMVGD